MFHQPDTCFTQFELNSTTSKSDWLGTVANCLGRALNRINRFVVANNRILYKLLLLRSFSYKYKKNDTNIKFHLHVTSVPLSVLQDVSSYHPEFTNQLYHSSIVFDNGMEFRVRVIIITIEKYIIQYHQGISSIDYENLTPRTMRSTGQ